MQGPAFTLKKRVNTSFWFLCIFFVLINAVSAPTIIWEIAAAFGLVSAQTYSAAAYYMNFILPQFLYPILSFVIMLCAVRSLKCSLKSSLKTSDVPVFDTFLCLFSFMGLSIASSYVSYLLELLLEAVGMPIPDMDLYIPLPGNVPETILFFVVIAVLPAICEELIYRGIVLGLAKSFSPKTAIIISALAFGLIHGTVQQIPFAFLVGLLLGLFYILYDSIALCMVLHFINNFISCLFTVIEPRMRASSYELLSNIFDIGFIALGVVSCFILIILWKKRKNEAGNATLLPPAIVSGKEARKAVVTSPGFWVFIVAALAYTALNIMLFALI